MLTEFSEYFSFFCPERYKIAADDFGLKFNLIAGLTATTKNRFS